MDQGLMKTRRLRLDEALKEICPNVYYQPPEGVKMHYPAIRYKRADIDHTSADNIPYLTNVAYELVVIDKDPDSTIVEKVSKLPRTAFTGHYVADNLNHDRFVTYA